MSRDPRRASPTWRSPAGSVLTRAAAAGLTLALLTACGGDGDPTASPGESATQGSSGEMVLATTTSTQDSGLLDSLVPAFEQTSECTVKTVAVGSGEALEMGAAGNADVLLVHSPAAEEQYMAEGNGSSRVAVMHNDFVLVGPKDDPAGAAKAGSAVDAFKAVAATQESFASRADESGTNAKELSLWKQAGITPAGSWFLKTGQGMGETLTIASQKQAYTLSDRGTYLATKGPDLDIVSEGGAELRNPYHVIVVDHEGTNTGCAEEFSAWLVGSDAQRMIREFGVEQYGEPLFFPDAK